MSFANTVHDGSLGSRRVGEESTFIVLMAPQLLGSLRRSLELSGVRSMNQSAWSADCLVQGGEPSGLPLFSSICPLSTHRGHHMRYYLDLDMLLGNKEEGPYNLLDNHLEYKYMQRNLGN